MTTVTALAFGDRRTAAAVISLLASGLAPRSPSPAFIKVPVMLSIVWIVRRSKG
jgi:hypothetical protein